MSEGIARSARCAAPATRAAARARSDHRLRRGSCKARQRGWQLASRPLTRNITSSKSESLKMKRLGGCARCGGAEAGAELRGCSEARPRRTVALSPAAPASWAPEPAGGVSAPVLGKRAPRPRGRTASPRRRGAGGGGRGMLRGPPRAPQARPRLTPGPAPRARLPPPGPPLPRAGGRPDPAQAAAGSPGLGAAGGADGAERSAGGGVGGGGWSREVRRVCGAFLYLLPRRPAAAARASQRPLREPPRVPARRRRRQHVGGQEAEDGRLPVACLPPSLRPAAPRLPGRLAPTLPGRGRAAAARGRGGGGGGRGGAEEGPRAARARPRPAAARLWEPTRLGAVAPGQTPELAE